MIFYRKGPKSFKKDKWGVKIMVNKIICCMSVNKVTLIYKLFKVGFKFHNGKGEAFIEIWLLKIY